MNTYTNTPVLAPHPQSPESTSPPPTILSPCVRGEVAHMQILRRSILRLHRRYDIAYSPASAALLNPRLIALSRSLLFSVQAPARSRLWPAAVSPPVAASFSSDLRGRPVSRFPTGSRKMGSSNGIEDANYAYEDANRLAVDVNDGKQYAGSAALEHEDVRRGTKNVIALYGDGHSDDDKEDEREEIEIDDDKAYDSTSDEDGLYCCDDVWPTNHVITKHPLENSSHRDGSIYRGTCRWKIDHSIADRNETSLEAMMLSDPKDCSQDGENCRVHEPHRMLQIFSLKLAKIPVDSGSVELYGYIAVRDSLDSSLNYVVNLSRDCPIIVEQGSLIRMTGPKRGIQIYGTILIEYDMRIKTEEEDRDLQLIDGVAYYDDSIISGHTFTNRIHGDCGAVDITLSLLDSAVEATVEVAISEVQSSFNLSLSSFISVLHDEIQLFHGTICESRGLRRSVVAVVMGTWMHLKFNVGSGSYSYAEHCCSFKAKKHRCDSQEIKTELAIISVKVTWSTLYSFYDPQKKLLIL
ncbi:hypothetical protein E2562_014718 [Oryza meyeriana var. granulata]|uniref:DUF6598 domain-containing protein n=1 Tax=Oryza meyeriana var. granulata TaxID=110450 RepID=A0A6G1BL03_9ORYZ|nr:hypothetical protein E2562_014718 [Oryza meyeriana var. granulata]